MTAYRFFPWVRRGVAAAVERPDPLGTAALPGRVPVTLALSVDGTAVPDGDRPVHLYGPGDVAALDPAQVVRAYPAPGATDAEPNYFAAVELDRPDLPWLLTPASPHAGAATVGTAVVPETENARLRPWICLAVVPQALEGVTLRAEAGRPLPVLRVPSAAQLPDLAESHLWAHAQALMSADETLARVDDAHPERTLSRLVCPRKLEPRTRYFAAVVPAWDAGRLAGLGMPAGNGSSFGPAWGPPGDPPTPVELPVYYHWEFTTGEPGDFEALVERIQPGALRAAEGLSLDATAPGSQLPSAGVLRMDGALRAADVPPRGRPEDVPAGFQSAVAARIAAARTAGDGTAPLAPPLYGGAPALRDTVDATAPAWLRALNLDPRHRAAAGLGARVVRRYQEQFVDAAWEQAGELRRANQALWQGQLAREVGGRLLKRWIEPLPAERLLAVSEPVHARLALPADAQRTGEETAAAVAMTVRAQVKGSALPDEAVSPASRRVLRPGGPLARRAAATRSLTSLRMAPPESLDGGGGALDGILRKLSQGGYSQPQGGGGVVLGDPTGMLPPENVPPRPEFTLAPTGAPAPAAGGDGAADNAVAAAFRAAAKQTQGAFVKARRVAAEAAAPPPALPLEQVRDAIVGGLDPAPAVAARVLSRVRVGGASASAALASTESGTGDALAGLGLTPSFHVPAYGLLAELSTHLLLPGGAEAMPPETAALVQTNPAFVAAFMAGLNHEVQRELLWREFPSDPRGTPFRRFWDTRGTAGGAPDVPAMTSWGQAALEDVGAGPAPDGDGDGQLVLVIRGELLRRYPGAVFYAVPGAWTKAEDGTPRRAPDPDAATHRMPLFRGTLGADVQLIGFDLDGDVARGSADPADGAPGWFFVIEQQPTEPRFGLDAQATPGGAPGWSELAWADVAPTPAGYLPVGAAGSRTVPAGGPVWGATAAHMAHITLRRPVRVAVHAGAMLPD